MGEPSGPVTQMNGAALLVDRQVAAGMSARPALYDGDTCYTYGDLLDGVNRVGHMLSDLGVQPEQRVALALPNCVEFVTGFLGAMKIGAVPVPISSDFGSRDYTAVLQDSRARVMIARSDLLRQLAPLRPQLPFLQQVVPADSGASWPAVAEHLTGTLPGLPLPMSPDDVAFMLYTSGTTGFPKGVVHLHRGLEQARAFADHILGMRPTDVVLSAAPLHLAFGLGNGLHIPLLYGASTILSTEPPTPRHLLRLIVRHRVTVLFALPEVYQRLLDDPEATPAHLRSLRLCISAGETLPAGVYARWRQRFGVELLDGFGSTELLYTGISNQPGQVKPGSVGTPVPGVAAIILDEDGQEVLPGHPGQLWVYSPSMFSRYWNREDLSRSVLVGPWLRTGDVCMRDEEGFFHLYGRMDDLFKVGGMWVSVQELESYIREHPAVAQAGVIGEPDAEGGTKPAMYVVVKPGYPPVPELEHELRAFLAEGLAAYKLPGTLAFVDRMPYTGSGKLQRHQLRQAGPGGSSAGSSVPPAPDRIAAFPVLPFPMPAPPVGRPPARSRRRGQRDDLHAGIQLKEGRI